MAEKKSEKHEFKDIVFQLHEQHKDVTGPFAKRLVDLYHVGDGDGLFYLVQSMQALLVMARELLQLKPFVAKEDYEEKH
jgi:hypothetical protein